MLQTVSPAGTSESIGLRYYQTNFYAQDAWRVRPNFTLSYGLRYEYNTPPREVDERIENTFSDPNLSLVPGLRTFLAGRTQIFDADRNNFAPRLGLAYAPRWFGADRYTVLRAGAGLYYDQALGAVVSQSRNVFPNFLTLNLAGQTRFDGAGFVIGNPAQPFFPCGTSFQALLQTNTVNTLNPAVSLACLAALTNSTGNNTFPAGFGFTLPARKLPTPSAGHYGVTLEQQLASNLFVSLGYVGTQGRHLLRQTTPNLGANAVLVPRITNVLNNEPNISGLALGPGQNINGLGQVVGGRPVANAGAVVLYEASANSRYDALQLQVRGRLRAALDYRLSYTYSRAEDEASDVFDLAGASALPQNSLTRTGERARANFDVPHRVTYIVGYDFGGVGRNFLLRDLQITSTGRWQSGQPFTVNSIFDVNLDGNLTDRLDNITGLRVTGNRRQPLELTGNATSLLAAVGQDGRIGRNSFRAGSVMELDLSLLKAFRVVGQQRLQVRLDVFNLTNRDNFGVPVRYVGAAGFGQAVDTVTPNRRLQVAIKYLF